MGLLLSRRVRETEEGGKARTMLALGLGMFWLSFGPRSVLRGHFEFLRLSGARRISPRRLRGFFWLPKCG